MDIRLIEGLVTALAPVIKEHMAAEIAPLKAEISELRSRSVKYLGVWRQREYSEGSMVSDDGSVWHCEKRTTTRPGTSADWVLAVKRGRDGKDAAS